MEKYDYSKPLTPLTKDIVRITEKRDYEVEQLKNTIELNFSEEVAREQLENVLKMNKQLKLLEDQLVVSRVTDASKNE